MVYGGVAGDEPKPRKNQRSPSRPGGYTFHRQSLKGGSKNLAVSLRCGHDVVELM